MKGYKIEDKFQYKGFDCLIVGIGLGHRCGYVALPKDHKYSGLGMGDLTHLDVHGMITWTNVGVVGEFQDRWVIGFDCGHFIDGKDVDLIKELTPPEHIEMRLEFAEMCGYTVRTNEYVRNEIEKLVEQL